jgi:hypothetical protein
MTNVVTLHGWTTPAAYDPLVDHTWVTTYDIPGSTYQDIGDVVAARQHFWYCWGGFLGSASAKIGSGSGSLEQATCVCVPNVTQGDNCHGTIYYYGIDGVCHQLANQLLAVTGNASLNASGVRGGNISCWFYGLYGLNGGDWASSARRCGVQTGRSLEMVIRPNGDSQPPQDKLQELDRIRDSFRAQVQALRPGLHSRSADPDALSAQINALVNEHLNRAADLLGSPSYQTLFGVPAHQPRTLVDPFAVSASMARLRTQRR